ncbi:hypothetical protein [Butyrivibrio sp. LC3010]|uniref:hypothetical protein n=1 Tax=Butyrivibrio sp. LC3010 TaxID=1280680 RepID=UPI000401F90A|nr:hypothetical protein [Butyrivibrio sp. LC3010]
MEKKLNTPLHTFTKGRDGGIDIRGYADDQNTIMQVKHYPKSNASKLISDLEK